VAIKGFGFTGFVSDSGKLFVGRPNKIEVGSSLNTQDINGYPFSNASGTLQIVDSFAELETYEVKITTASYDKIELQRVLDQYTSTESSISLPEAKEYVIGAGGVVTVTGLLVDQAVGAFIQSDTNPVQLTQITTGSPTAKQYKVTADTITFETSQVGKTVVVQYNKTFTSVETLGAQDLPVGNLLFFGRVIGTRFAIAPRLFIPKMVRRSGINLGTGDTTSEYRALVKSPFAKPVLIAFDQA
jgi:hypothetical protein